jgi:hypothetical protein
MLPNVKRLHQCGSIRSWPHRKRRPVEEDEPSPQPSPTTSVDEVDHGIHTHQGHFYTAAGSFHFSDMGSGMG